jgi:hypothetical protein
MPTANEQRTERRTRRPEGAGCPACSHRLATPVQGFTQVYRCAKCDAVYGSCYLGDSYSLVLPYFVESEPPVEQTRYFDFDCLGSKGVTRRHGWYDLVSKRIVQVG